MSDSHKQPNNVKTGGLHVKGDKPRAKPKTKSESKESEEKTDVNES